MGNIISPKISKQTTCFYKKKTDLVDLTNALK